MIERLGKYQIEAQIGRGGMGAVYRARDPLLKRQVALKVISENVDMSEELRARFFREAQACAQLGHPNIITIYDLGEDEGRLYIVMEYLEGEELKQIITQRRDLSLESKLALMMQVCDGLAYAHEKGIVHRDIKPSNVFVVRGGTAKVLDFGVARLASASDDLTRADVIMGTLRYMSPEQARGRVDQRSDMFSAAAVFYELMAYRSPLAAADPIAIFEELCSTATASIFQPDPAIPEDLGAVIERALRKNPDDRFRDMTEMRQALEGVRARLAEEAAGLRRRLEARAGEVRDLHGQLVEQVDGDVAPQPFSTPTERAPLAALEAAWRDSEESLRRLQERVLRARALRPEYERAKGRGRLGQWDAAAEALEAIVEQMPEHAGAQEELARARAEILRAAEALQEREAAGRAQQLMEDLRRRAAPAAAVEDQEGPWSSAETSRASGLAALDGQRFTSARELFDAAAEQYRTAAEALDRRIELLLADARRRLEGRQFEECVPLVGEVLALLPDHPEATALSREANEGLRVQAERRAAFERRYEAARSELAAGRHQEAIDALSALVEEDPDYSRARRLLADARAQLAEREAEARRRQAEEEARARRLRDEEEARTRRLQEEAETRRRRAEEEARIQRLRAEEAARAERLRAEAHARQLEEEARARRAEEAARAERLRLEAQTRQAKEEARARQAEEAARAERLRAGVEARRSAERGRSDEAGAGREAAQVPATGAVLRADPSKAAELDHTVVVPVGETTAYGRPSLGASQDTAETRGRTDRRRLLLVAAVGAVIVAAALAFWITRMPRLQEEVARARQQVVSAREAALAAGAGQLASSLIEQARAKEREAEQLVEARRPDEALGVFRDATSLYERGGQTARAAAEELARAAAAEKAKADEARASMLTAKGQAAPEAKAYTEALAREAEGNDHYGRQAFPDAAGSYGAAGRLYATARPPAVAPPPPTAQTPPAPPPPPAPDADIRATLNAYARAYQGKDSALLQQVWPSISADELSRINDLFGQARSIQVTLRYGPIKVNGNEAEVTARREVAIVMSSNETVRNVADLRFRLRRANNRWTIAAVAR